MHNWQTDVTLSFLRMFSGISKKKL
jgi:hypothetical protein